MWLWAPINQVILCLVNRRIQWPIDDGEELRKEERYLMIRNHLSWTDIVVTIKLHELDEQIRRDYFQDKHHNRQFQSWLKQVWLGKDQRLQEIHRK